MFFHFIFRRQKKKKSFYTLSVERERSGPTLSAAALVLAHSCVTWPLEIDNEIFDFYLDGKKPDECAAALALKTQEIETILDLKCPQDRGLLLEEVHEQYHLFKFLQSFFERPLHFLSFKAFPIELQKKKVLIEKFYTLDATLAREWFGDRLSRLDATATSLRETVSEEYVLRQWDNIKRVCKQMSSSVRGEDGTSFERGITLVSAVQSQFAFSRRLAGAYATLTFGYEHHLTSAPFADLSFDHLEVLCAALASWCDSTQLIISEPFCDDLGRVKSLLTEGRLIYDLYEPVLGEPPPKRWATFLGIDELSSPATNLPPRTPSGSVGSMISQQTPGRFSRRFVNEFPSFAKSLSKVCAEIATSKDIRKTFDAFWDKMVLASVQTPVIASSSPLTPRPQALRELALALTYLSNALPRVAKSVSSSDRMFESMKVLCSVFSLFLQLLLPQE